MNKWIFAVLESWKNTEGNVNSTDQILDWIENLNKSITVVIQESGISDSSFWFYDDYNGEILNRKRSFFSIKGIRRFEDGALVSEQPVILQPEIGYLGILCKEIDGVLNFLMQAKIEPGNVNHVQLSPTIQATKSNFTRAHGGDLPTYFELFENSKQYHVIYDQIQSEQAARFYKKRNRNMILEVEDEIEVYPNFKWMTLGQIKTLMGIDNLVNMDTRTVLSGIPLSTYRLTPEELKTVKNNFHDFGFYKSIFETDPADTITKLYQPINNYKMFHNIHNTLIPLYQLVDWEVNEYGITCRKSANFMVRYYDISISGREVQHWTQPLFKAIGAATFVLLLKDVGGVTKYLVSLRSEIGTFDKIEIGPSIQLEANQYLNFKDAVKDVFETQSANKAGIILDVVLSEEGGRFYHEQNRNVIMKIPEDALTELPENYFWVDYSGLSDLMQVNNCLNIQLRNLLSLLPI
ncbi:MAG: NDP-hexose 2,3-dehydratase family protein [Clostridiales Family XIII bacterium]|jgi:oxidase EvaA|nr:NDP-hexose 2,3-dehydratase family protein [Clostridiales Family XIII bacterium]